MQLSLNFLFVFAFLFLFLACAKDKNDTTKPSKFLSEKEMVEILSELQTADAASARTGVNAETRKLQKGIYNEAIFEKYKTTSKDFYANYDYYAHNVAEMDTIYAQVMKNLEAQLKVETERMKAHPPKVVPPSPTPAPAPNLPRNIQPTTLQKK
jgi:hypothetical protein